MKLVKKLCIAKIYLFAAIFFTVPAFAFEPLGKSVAYFDKKFPVDGFIELFIAIGLILAFKLAQKKNKLL